MSARSGRHCRQVAGRFHLPLLSDYQIYNGVDNLRAPWRRGAAQSQWVEIVGVIAGKVVEVAGQLRIALVVEEQVEQVSFREELGKRTRVARATRSYGRHVPNCNPAAPYLAAARRSGR